MPSAAPLPVLISKIAAALGRAGHPENCTEATRSLVSAATGIDASLEGGQIVLDQPTPSGVRHIRLSTMSATITGPDGPTASYDVGPRRTEHHESAIKRLKSLLQEHPVRVAVSGGKDSATVAALVLDAARSLKWAGQPMHPIYVTSSDTLVESPEVRAQLLAIHASIEAFTVQHGLCVECEIAEPSMLQRWWPKMLAGRKLPSYVGQQGDCSVDLKVKPQETLARRISKDLAARGLPDLVTLTGTRFAESERRKAHMKERGESSDTVVNRRLSPIAHWSDSEVFDFLADSRASKFPHDWDGLLEFYAASSRECVIVPDKAIQSVAGKCGSRSGCFVCQQVAKDHSATELATKPGYEYLQPLVALNDYIRAIRWDFGRRHWIGKRLDTVTQHIQIGPNCFSFAECDRLLRMLLTIDCDERVRAERTCIALARGEIEDTPRNRRLREPQFCNVPFEDLLAIDFMRSVDALGPEHSALLAWHDVVVCGERLDIPSLEQEVRTPVPSPRYAPLDLRSVSALDAGMDDPLAVAMGEPSIHRTDFLTGESELRHPNESPQPRFVVDQEAAGLFLAFEFHDRVLHARKRPLGPTSAARYYLRLGTVQIPRGQSAEIDRQMHRSIARVHQGLGWSADPALIESIDDSQHRAMRQAAAAALGIDAASSADQTEVQRRALNAIVDEASAIPPAPCRTPEFLFNRSLSVQWALAAGVVAFDGTDLKLQKKRLPHLLRRAEAVHGALTQARRDQLARQANEAAQAFREGRLPILAPDAAGLLPLIAIGAVTPPSSDGTVRPERDARPALTPKFSRAG